MKKYIVLLLALFIVFTTRFVDAAGNQPYPKSIITYNSSVVIATGNTFQAILSASTSGRQSLTIQNNNASDSCWISFGSGITAANATKANSILLSSGQAYTRYYPFTPNDEIEGTCATSSDTVYIDVQ